MADLQAICEGLAANGAALKTAGLIKQVSAYPLENPTAPALLVAGVEPAGYEYVTFGGGAVEPSIRLSVLVQVVLGKLSAPVTFKLLHRLMAATGSESLVATIEADPQLTSRYQEDGTGDFDILTSQAAAADFVSFNAYRGQSIWTAESGIVYVSANWAFEVRA